MATIYQTGDVVLHNWTIEKPIGEGSYGKVYQIGRDDFGTHYSAALKIISVPQSEAERRSIEEEGLTDQEVTQYFYTMVEEIVKEFALMAQFKGTANIVSYEDHQVVAHDDGNGWDIFIRMELLTPLQTHLASHPISQRDVAHLAVDLCKALELCQKYNVIHRDIKPENIFVSPNGDFKLGDFGIARTIERTSSGLSKKGTYSYMAPEVYRGLEYGFTVDTYSLGLVLYRFLNQNRLPFMPTPPAPLSFSDREKALATRISGSSLPLPFYGKGGLAEIICKACSYDPGQRYPSASSLRLAVESLGELSPELLQTDLSTVPHHISSEGGGYHTNQQEMTDPTVSSIVAHETEERTTGIFATEPVNLSSPQRTNTGEGLSEKSLWLMGISFVAVVSLAVGLGFFLGTQGDADTESVLEEASASSFEGDSAATLEGQVVNALDGLNIRESDSLDSEILSKLSNGSIVEILRDTGTGWYEIYFTGNNGTETGYVMVDYVVLAQGGSSSEYDSTTLDEQIFHAEAEGFVLDVMDNEIVLFQYTGAATDIVIPDIVTRIGAFAFLSTTVVTVTMGNSVTSMGVGAFRGCDSLKSITLSDAITVIEDFTFDNCSKLENITATGVTHIGDYAFAHCESIDTSFMTDSLLHIGKSAFAFSGGITDLVIPSSVEFIGYEAFTSCSNLKQVTIYSPNIAIEEYVFLACLSLTSVYVLEDSNAVDYFKTNYHYLNLQYL